MKKAISGMFVGVVLLAQAATASAGYHVEYPVMITPDGAGGGTAQGMMGSARNSSDTQQSIGCSVVGGTTGATVLCVARDASGTPAYCFSFDAGKVQAVGAITSDSRILFSWDQSSHCTYLMIDTASVWAPKQP